MKSLLFITTASLIALTIFNVCAAQSTTEASQLVQKQIESMEKLQLWAGHWKGSGWASISQGHREGFIIDETVEPRLQGQVLLIEGRGFAEANGQMVHEALGVLSFDPNDEVYRFRTYDHRGEVRDSEFHVEEDHYRWGFKDRTSGVLLRFTIKIEEETWYEFTEVSPDEGSNWYKMMEMNLTRVK